MPLQDSFSSRRPSEQSSVPHAPKPNRLPKPPTRDDLEFTHSCAISNPNVPLGLMWKKGSKAYLLTVMSGVDSRRNEPAWVLHSGTDQERTVVWSYRSSDLNFIFARLGELGSNAPAPASDPVPVGLQSGEFPAWTNELPLGDVVLEPGTVFADHYEILSEIGVGGMGVVYRAADRKSNREVAIKLLHAHLVSDPVSKKRFEQEAHAAMTLAHPNLISVYHYGFSAQGLPFLVMEFIDGPGLDQVLKERRQLEITEFVDIFVQSTEGLAHAHDKGIIHRDLKPSNIMLLKEGDKNVVKILDFGIAKLLIRGDTSKQDLTLAGDILGSPLYMSPEQCKCDALDVRSDIYSLGCLMYHAISGVVPFEGENTLQTMGKHICDAPARLNIVRPDLVVPLKLQDIIFKCLEKAPENRFADVHKLHANLKVVQADLNPVHSSESLPVTNAPSLLLVESGDLPATTLQAALKVQQMLRAGSMTLVQASDALGRAHLAGGQINVLENAAHAGGNGIETPVEAILVEAGLITNSTWRTLLSVHQKMRSGHMTKEEALEELRKLQPPKVAVAVAPKKHDTDIVPKDVLEMIKHAGIISPQEIEEAARVANEEGTDLAKRLVALGKLDNKVLLAARQCLSLIENGRLQFARAIIALVYCHRCRVSFYEAVEELGWERP